VSPKRLERVAPPPVKGEWEVRFGTSEAAKGWDELCTHTAGKTREAFDLLRVNPRPPQDGRTRGTATAGPGGRRQRWRVALPKEALRSSWSQVSVNTEVHLDGLLSEADDPDKAACWISLVR
jgi:hypothetical protein